MRAASNFTGILGFLLIVLNLILHYAACTSSSSDSGFSWSRGERLFFAIAFNSFFIAGVLLLGVSYLLRKMAEKKNSKEWWPFLPGDIETEDHHKNKAR